MKVKFLPDAGNVLPGGFVEVKSGDGGTSKEKIYERNTILQLSIEVPSLVAESKFYLPGGIEVRHTNPTRKELKFRTRQLSGVGRIPVFGDSGRESMISSISPLGSRLSGNRLSVTLNEGKFASVSFFCFSDDLSFRGRGVELNLSLEIHVPVDVFDEIAEIVQDCSKLMIIDLDLSECAGCLAEYTNLPYPYAIPREVKFLSAYNIIENPNEIPSDYFGNKALGDGALAKISFRKHTEVQEALQEDLQSKNDDLREEIRHLGNEKDETFSNLIAEIRRSIDDHAERSTAGQLIIAISIVLAGAAVSAAMYFW